MTILEAISKADALTPNTYTQEDKIDWLSRADWIIKKQVIDKHEGCEAVEFDGYNADTDTNTVLLVPAPFDEMYLRYLEAQVHYHNAEYAHYNNAILLFNTAMQAYKNEYTQDHMPLSKGRRFLF